MISAQKIPTVKRDESFKYVKMSFNIGMDLHQTNKELESKFEKYFVRN